MSRGIWLAGAGNHCRSRIGDRHSFYLSCLGMSWRKRGDRLSLRLAFYFQGRLHFLIKRRLTNLA